MASAQTSVLRGIALKPVLILTVSAHTFADQSGVRFVRVEDDLDVFSRAVVQTEGHVFRIESGENRPGGDGVAIYADMNSMTAQEGTALIMRAARIKPDQVEAHWTGTKWAPGAPPTR
jgi:hypothetical protein